MPSAAMRPPSRRSTRSASAMVDTRWATTRVVAATEPRSPSRIARSTVASTAEVASSSRSSRGRRSRARARAMRWRWPPDRVTPRSPMTSSSPWGSRSTNVRARAIVERGPASRRRRRRRPWRGSRARCRRRGTTPGTPGRRPRCRLVRVDVGQRHAAEADLAAASGSIRWTRRLHSVVLPGAGRAHEGDDLARRDAGGHAVEHRPRRRRRSRRRRATTSSGSVRERHGAASGSARRGRGQHARRSGRWRRPLAAAPRAGSRRCGTGRRGCRTAPWPARARRS